MTTVLPRCFWCDSTTDAEFIDKRSGKVKCRKCAFYEKSMIPTGGK